MIYNKHSSVKDFLLDLIMPNRCPFCQEFIPYNALSCSECEESLELTEDRCCPYCGRPECICGNDILYYSRCYSAAFYKGTARKGIHDLKFQHGANAAYIFGDIIREKLEADDILGRIDCAVPVPMSAKNERLRGYNQARIIAERIVLGTDIPVVSGALLRRHSKTAQHFLNAEERRKAVYEQYSLAGKITAGKTVLLCDDVMTTGSTINRCAELLATEGAAAEVIAAVCTIRT